MIYVGQRVVNSKLTPRFENFGVTPLRGGSIAFCSPPVPPGDPPSPTNRRRPILLRSIVAESPGGRGSESDPQALRPAYFTARREAWPGAVAFSCRWTGSATLSLRERNPHMRPHDFWRVSLTP